MLINVCIPFLNGPILNRISYTYDNIKEDIQVLAYFIK